MCCMYGQYVVGELHFKGEGGAGKSHTEALACYRAAANQGHDGALFELGYLHRSPAAQHKGLRADSYPPQQYGIWVFAGRHSGAEFLPAICISRQPGCLLQRGRLPRARPERGR